MSYKEIEKMTKEELTSYISQTLDKRTLWEQLAEKSSELAKAALKYIRAAGYSNNPTPISERQAMENVEEELRDTLHVCSILRLVSNVDVNEQKLKRWVRRIKGESDTPEEETLVEKTGTYMCPAAIYKCSYCGKLITEPVNYCTYCGRKVKVVTL